MEKQTDLDLESRELSKLATLIPLSNITLAVHIYNLLKNIEVKHYSIIDPELELNNIEKALEGLNKKQWLSGEEVVLIYKHLTHTMVRNSHNNVSHLFVSRFFNRKGAPRKDLPFDFLCYAIITDVKTYSGSPHYKTVLDFFGALNVLPSPDFFEEELRKRYKRLVADDIHAILNTFQTLDNDYFCDNLFPSTIWDDDMERPGFCQDWLKEPDTDLEGSLQRFKTLLQDVEWTTIHG